MKVGFSTSTAILAVLVLGLVGVACGGADGAAEGEGGTSGAGGIGGSAPGGSGGTNPGGGGTGGGHEGGSGGTDDREPGPSDGQGIFGTLNGVSLAATIGTSDGYVQDASLEAGAGYSHVVATAMEEVDGELVTWTLWFPRAVGIYACGSHTAGEQIAFISIENTKAGRSGANSGISADACSLAVTRFEPQGIIAGTFSGSLGGFLGQAQAVTDGSFYFDNSRGGGDCSLASDPGVPAGEFGATVSIQRLELSGENPHRMPKYLRCGQNLRLDPERSADMNIKLGGGRADMAPSIFFRGPNVFYGGVDTTLQLSGIDRSGGANENCAFGIFQGFRSDSSGEGLKCRVSLSAFDEEVREGTFEATMARDGNLVDIVGSFRIPTVFTTD